MRRISKGKAPRGINPCGQRTLMILFMSLTPLMTILYIQCSFPSLFIVSLGGKRREAVDTHQRDVKVVENAHLLANNFDKPGISKNLPDDSVPRPPGTALHELPHGMESGVDPSLPLNAADMRFRVEHHGYQCLVYSSLGRKVVPKAENEVSWVTQLTVDRLTMLDRMLERWNGPISAALYSQDVASDVREIEKYRDRVDFHIVGASQGLYPVNTLRNVAMNNARGDYLVLADADFVPSMGMYEYILGIIPKLASEGKSVFVVPAFEIDSGEQADKPPRTKQDLKAMGSKIHQVHNDPARSIAHKYTDYDKWMTATEIYSASYKFPYEPYMLVPRAVPRFDVRFYGYGNDKASHCYELDKAGYAFKVLPEAFVVHIPHPQGSWVQQTFMDPKERVSRTLTSFLTDVDRRYGVRKFADAVEDFEPLPAAAKFEVVVGRLGEACTTTCAEKGKVCHAEWSERINQCRELEKYMTCTQGCNDGFFGSDLPAYNTQREQCLINNSPKSIAFNCPVTYQFSRRLCPCGAPS